MTVPLRSATAYPVWMFICMKHIVWCRDISLHTRHTVIAHYVFAPYAENDRPIITNHKLNCHSIDYPFLCIFVLFRFCERYTYDDCIQYKQVISVDRWCLLSPLSPLERSQLDEEIIQSFRQQEQRRKKMRLKRKASGFPPGSFFHFQFFFSSFLFIINIKVILVVKPLRHGRRYRALALVLLPPMPFATNCLMIDRHPIKLEESLRAFVCRGAVRTIRFYFRFP